MPVNLKDIAAMVGVSVSTVSLVLNGKAIKSRISEELEKKILEVAAKNNYRPNMLARGLRKGTTHSIGFVVSNISNAIFVKLARNIAQIMGVSLESARSVIYLASKELRKGLEEKGHIIQLLSFLTRNPLL